MEELIKLAANTKSFGLKGNAQFKNILKNKNCGDEIKIEFDLKNKQISNFRYEGESMHLLPSIGLVTFQKYK